LVGRLVSEKAGKGGGGYPQTAMFFEQIAEKQPTGSQNFSKRTGGKNPAQPLEKERWGGGPPESEKTKQGKGGFNNPNPRKRAEVK